jgi:hypothetical protein
MKIYFIGVALILSLVTGVQAEVFYSDTRGNTMWLGSSTLNTYPGCTAHEYECTICGKTLFEHRESRSGWSSYTLSVGSCERDDGKTLTIPWSIKVCRDCYDKYIGIVKVMNETMNEKVKAWKADSVKERLINEEKRRVQKLKDVQQEVDRLQQRLKELQR